MQATLKRLPEAAKAFTAAAAAFAATYATAASDGAVSQQDWYVIVGSTLVAFVGTFLVPNSQAKA